MLKLLLANNCYADMDILEDLLLKRNQLNTSIEELTVEYHLEHDDDGRLPILSAILDLRMNLTSLQNEIIDIQSSKLSVLKENQPGLLADASLSNNQF